MGIRFWGVPGRDPDTFRMSDIMRREYVVLVGNEHFASCRTKAQAELVASTLQNLSISGHGTVSMDVTVRFVEEYLFPEDAVAIPSGVHFEAEIVRSEDGYPSLRYSKKPKPPVVPVTMNGLSISAVYMYGGGAAPLRFFCGLHASEACENEHIPYAAWKRTSPGFACEYKYANNTACEFTEAEPE